MKQTNILVVDDDVSILEAIRIALEFEGYKVDILTQAESLLRLSGNFPDLILLDVLLSGVDGRDICRQIKKATSTKNIPIIMISAHPSAEKTVMSAGADDFLAKPFDIDDLLSKVKKFTKES